MNSPDLSLPREVSPAKAVALIVLFGLVAYANSINAAFVFDDLHWIVQNPLIGEPLEYIRSWGNRWLVAVTLLLNHRFGGLEPAGYHVFNLAVHVGAALTVFGLVRRTLLLPRWGGRFDAQAAGLALVCSLVWMLHPLQTQSVTYVVQRCESLMGLFYLLTVYCALRSFAAEAAWKWHFGAVAACGLGMMSKEVMVTAPLMVVVFDRVFLALPWREQLRRRWPLYLGLAATCILLTPAVLGALPTTDAEVSVGFGVKGITPLSYAMTQPGVILHYLRLTVWPDRLCLDYWDWPAAAAWGDWLPQTLALLLLVVGTVIGLGRRSWLGFLGAWFFGILALTSSFVPIDDKAFEHRLYLPLLALVVAVVAGVAALLSRLSVSGAQRLSRAIGIWLALGVITGLTLCTARRNADYASVERLWRDVIAKRPGNPRAYVSLGATLLDAGRLDEAAEAFRTTLQLRPGEPKSHNNLGIIRARQGRLDEAGRHFRAAIVSRPNYASAHHQLGLVLLRQKQLAAAFLSFERAVELEVRGSYRFALAFALAESGQAGAAERERAQALLLDPSGPRRMAGRARGLIFADQPNEAGLQEALLLARQAAFAQPDAESLYVLASAWSGNGSSAEAKRIAQLGLRHAHAEGDLELAAQLATRFDLEPQK